MFRVDAANGRGPRAPRRLHLERAAAWETSALRQFLVDLHVQLYLPDPWGLILTGILGLMMMAAVISGVLMHRHLIRDLFVAERAGGPAGLGARPARAGGELEHSLRLPARLHRLVLQLRRHGRLSRWWPRSPSAATRRRCRRRSSSRRCPRTPPRRRSRASTPSSPNSRTRAPGRSPISASRTTGAPTPASIVWHDPADGGMLYVTNVYDGASGAFLGRQAPVGTAPSVGGHALRADVPAALRPFRRPAVARRSGARSAWRCASSSSPASGSGSGAALATAAWRRLRACGAGRRLRPAARRCWPRPTASSCRGPRAIPSAGRRWASWSARWPPSRSASRPGPRGARARYRRLLGGACLWLPLLRLATGGMDWAEALLQRQTDVLTVDLLLLFAGLWLLRRRPAPRQVAVEPAE